MTPLYLHGFASGPGSSKARQLRERFAAEGIELTVPDLAEGDFTGLTITKQLAVIDRAVDGQTVDLIGSSLGGYLAALYAARHANVRRVVLLAPAFDFARRWSNRFSAEQMRRWRELGALPVFHYVTGKLERIGYGLYEDALQYEAFPAVKQPALIIHGERDEVVPVELSREFAAQRANATLLAVDSDHALTDQLNLIWRETRSFING